MAKISKSSEKQLQLASQARTLCNDWPVGECRGLHIKSHKTMVAVWRAGVSLGLLATNGDVDQGGYYRFCRTSRTVE